MSPKGKLVAFGGASARTITPGALSCRSTLPTPTRAAPYSMKTQYLLFSKDGLESRLATLRRALT